jgi:2-dehydropantoate 2-reductase
LPTVTDFPRIAIVGCGALGGYYGAQLTRAGRDVHCLLRSDFETVRKAGLRVLSRYGDFTAHPNAARHPSEVGPCDLVIIGLKTTANGALPRLLPPLMGPETAVLTLQNGLGNEEALAACVGGSRVLGGLCFVCLNRIAPGVIQHLAHGRIVMGEFQTGVTPRAEKIAAWFREATIPCDVTENLGRAHWEKLVWNIPFNGLGVASVAGLSSVLQGKVIDPARPGPCLATDVLLADKDWLQLVRELMHETIHAARAQGFEVPDSAADAQIERTLQMGAYRASTLIDFEEGRPLEIEALFSEPLRRARKAGLEPPRLAALEAVLRELSVARREVTAPQPHGRDPS